LASNGGTASASSQLDAMHPAGAAINGDRLGLHWGSNPSTGSGWCDATKGVYPDWLRVDFKGKKTIDEIDVFTAQDDITAPLALTKDLTFTGYGITEFEVQYWNGSDWQTLRRGVSGNNLVWRQFNFLPVKTTAIRVLVKNALEKGAAKIIAHTRPDNPGSIAVLKNCGFRPAVSADPAVLEFEYVGLP